MKPLWKFFTALFLTFVFLGFLISPFHCFTVSADNAITDDFSISFPKNQKFIDVSGGTLLLSTDGKKYTKAAFLKDKNNFESALWVFQIEFVYEEAFPSDTFVYMVEKSSTENGLRIGWLDLKTQTFYAYTAAIKLLSPTRWEITQDGELLLGAVELSGTQPGTYHIQMCEKPFDASFVPDASSSQSSSVSSASTSESNTEKPVTKYRHTFPEGTTISSLEKEYAAYSRILVYDNSGILQKSGRLHTGWSIHLYEGSTLTCIITSIIPGDLGGQNDSQNRELYFRYLAGEIDLKDPYFTAADLNGDGSITVSDLVIFRKSHG